MEPEVLDNEQLTQLMELRDLYKKTTKIANHCFDTCFDRPHIGRVEEKDRNCVNNCANNYLLTELLFMRRLMTAVQQSHSHDAKN
jgi:hypothetical protein